MEISQKSRDFSIVDISFLKLSMYKESLKTIAKTFGKFEFLCFIGGEFFP